MEEKEEVFYLINIKRGKGQASGTHVGVFGSLDKVIPLCGVNMTNVESNTSSVWWTRSGVLLRVKCSTCRKMLKHDEAGTVSTTLKHDETHTVSTTALYTKEEIKRSKKFIETLIYDQTVLYCLMEEETAEAALEFSRKTKEILKLSEILNDYKPKDEKE